MMNGTFELSVGGGRASAHLDLSRSVATAPRRLTGVIAFVLVLPVAALLASAALASATGNSGLSISNSNLLPERLGLGLVLLLPLAALALLVVTRVRLTVSRIETGWRGRLSLQLAPLELAAALLGLFLVLFFIGHLLADGYACANGIRQAC